MGTTMNLNTLEGHSLNKSNELPKTKGNARKDLIQKFLKCRAYTEQICAPLATEDYVVQPIPEVSPPKWHLAHTTWFFEELILRKNLNDYKRFHEVYPLLFNSYYKAAGEHWIQSKRGMLSRPRVSEIKDYRKYVTESVAEYLEKSPEDPDVDFLVDVGIHHEQQHQELLLMDIKYILGVIPFATSYSIEKNPRADSLEIEWKKIDSGLYDIGHNGSGFSYDNEGPFHQAFLHSTGVRNTSVTNGEYLEFIKDGGYKKPKLWLSQGWDWVQKNNIQTPLYWNLKPELSEYTLNGLEELDLNKPVSHISYFEADAFANWTGYRLPTEFEMEVYLNQTSTPTSEKDNLHPINSDKSSLSLWWWTRSHYSPYPGYRSFEGMIEEYNGKFMCNQFVLKGGACITPKDHYRHSYRNFYLPEQRWMFSGLRLARDI